ncbi:MAG: ABC transporter ATP-binding protein/permease [Actinomycetes bacterium]|nr:ABC transporter ATP-binding protein/permease [Actinomycetes bacterium]
MSRVIENIKEYLRINAIKRLFSMVDVRKSEVFRLVFLAGFATIFEGFGMTLLLPIMQFVENRSSAIADSGNTFWQLAARFLALLGLSADNILALLVLAFIPIILRNVVLYISTRYSSVVASRIAMRMRLSTLDAVLHADPSFFGCYSRGELSILIVNQTAVAGQAVLAVISQISFVLFMLLYVAIMAKLSLLLTLLTCALGVVVSIAIRANTIAIRRLSRETVKINQTMSGKIVEWLELIRLIKLRDRTDDATQRIERFSEEIRSRDILTAKLGARTELISDPLLMFAAFTVVFFGITVLGMKLAQLGLIVILVTRLNAKIKEFNLGLQAISKASASVTLVQDTVTAAQTANTIHGGEIKFSGLADTISFQDVRFRYPRPFRQPARGGFIVEEKEILKGISMDIHAGNMVALVGRSGAGKSTLVELLPRMHEANSGSITLDGVSIKEFSLGSLRRGISYLTQTPMLFNDTVRANLLYGLDYSPTDEEIRTALEKAYATFILRLPDGVDTRIGDGGARFSGGERQRLALARVMLERNSIIILDEPTSALDSESEGYIQQALTALHGKVTIIVIAHRLATVVSSDRIFLIDDGQILEQGTHAELIDYSGVYRALFDSQLII